MTFRGWPAEALDFFSGLEADNSKAYWSAHKELYETAVRAPMVELLGELEPEFGPGKIFRPHRDVRFSTDKSPYKTAMGAMLGSGYVQLSSRGLAAGVGMYQLAPDQLTRYRQAVDDEVSGGALERLIAGAKVDVTGHGSLRTAPRGYPADHPRVHLLRHKGLTTWREWPVAAWLGTSAAKTRLRTFLLDSQPLREWLDRHVGPSTEPDRR